MEDIRDAAYRLIVETISKGNEPTVAEIRTALAIVDKLDHEGLLSA